MNRQHDADTARDNEGQGGPDLEEIIRYIAATYDDVTILRPTEGPGAGDIFFVNDPDPKRQFPFATIVTKDYGDFDNASRLDRPGVYRLNVGLGRDTFRRLFGAAADIAAGAHDYAALDRLMPHPVYAPQRWVSVLNPSAATFDTLKPLLDEAHARMGRRGEDTGEAG